MVARAHRAVGDVEFSPMDATRADRPFLAQLVRAAVAAGAKTINIPDTVGYALPHQVADLFTYLREAVPELEGAVLSFHGQNDLGMASANAIAAVSAGARQVELCVNGIGERAGQHLVRRGRDGDRRPRRRAWAFTRTSTRPGSIRCRSSFRSGAASRSRRTRPSSGRNAFRHASGIHQDGVLKHRLNFECIDPAQIGHPTGTEIVLGKLSGTAGFASKARELGFDLRGAAAQRAFAAFQALADRQRDITRRRGSRNLLRGREAPTASALKA